MDITRSSATARTATPRSNDQPVRVDKSTIPSWDGSGFGVREKLGSTMIGAVMGGSIVAMGSFLGWALLPSGPGPGLALTLMAGGMVTGAALAYTDERQRKQTAWEQQHVPTDIETIVDNEFLNYDTDGDEALERPEEWRTGPIHGTDGRSFYWDRSEAFSTITGHEDGRITKDELTVKIQEFDINHDGGISASEAEALEGLLSYWTR